MKYDYVVFWIMKFSEVMKWLGRKKSSATGPLAIIEWDIARPPICAIKMKATKDIWERRWKGSPGCMSGNTFFTSVGS